MSFLPLTIPEVIIDYIYTYIPISIKMQLNNSNFTTYYPLVINTFFEMSPPTSYIIDVIRCNRTKSLSLLLEHNYAYLIKNRKYKYKNYIFPTIIDFIKFLCIKYGKQKCLQHLISYEKENNLYDKKPHKKIKIKSIRWSN